MPWLVVLTSRLAPASALCLSSILQAQVRVDQDRGAVTATLGELVAAVAAKQWPAGGQAINSIRVLVTVNLGLGFLTIAVATLGRLAG